MFGPLQLKVMGVLPGTPARAATDTTPAVPATLTLHVQLMQPGTPATGMVALNTIPLTVPDTPDARASFGQTWETETWAEVAAS